MWSFFRCGPAVVRGSARLDGGVLLVVQWFEPGGGVGAVGVGLEEREVAHERVGRGAVPVLLPGWADHGVARAGADDRAVTRAHQTDALGDVQRLAHVVGVPDGP